MRKVPGAWSSRIAHLSNMTNMIPFLMVFLET
jgi:hypothetical protein